MCRFRTSRKVASFFLNGGVHANVTCLFEIWKKKGGGGSILPGNFTDWQKKGGSFRSPIFRNLIRGGGDTSNLKTNSNVNFAVFLLDLACSQQSVLCVVWGGGGSS